MNWKLFVIGLIVSVISGASSYAKTIEVGASQVAVIVPQPADDDPSHGPRVCIKFDLPQGVAGVEIGFGDLALSIALPAGADDSLAIFEAFALSSSWNAGVGWIDFPVPGGDLDSSLYSTNTVWCGRDSLLSLDVTEMAQRWNLHPEENFGVILIPRRTDWRAIREARFMPEQIRSRAALRIVVPGRAAE
ncbi:MAG: hypothetical protein A2W25_07040 [candidate division Zixibacteria bacterium RBG_16_53_22]|nr:MAG: hypothetical protein A2W25_07040 [candidate division Zixibacteria bacterium RBG_16_53_22]